MNFGDFMWFNIKHILDDCKDDCTTVIHWKQPRDHTKWKPGWLFESVLVVLSNQYSVHDNLFYTRVTATPCLTSPESVAFSQWMAMYLFFFYFFHVIFSSLPEVQNILLYFTTALVFLKRTVSSCQLRTVKSCTWANS